jgi:hypothetical protein
MLRKEAEEPVMVLVVEVLHGGVTSYFQERCSFAENSFRKGNEDVRLGTTEAQLS